MFQVGGLVDGHANQVVRFVPGFDACIGGPCPSLDQLWFTAAQNDDARSPGYRPGQITRAADNQTTPGLTGLLLAARGYV